MSPAELLMQTRLLKSRAAAFFSAEKKLLSARYAYPHELAPLLSPRLDGLHLLLAESMHRHILRVATSPTQRKLGNLLLCGPTGRGKSQHLTSQILTFPGSLVIYDIKGELHRLTAGFRATVGPVYVLDPTGFGHQYDPFRSRLTESKLYAAAHNLLYEPREGDGRSFAEKGMQMLMIVFLAGRAVNRRAGRTDAALVPFLGNMVDLGLNRAVAFIDAISPALSRRFLDEDYNPRKDYTENRYLVNSWQSATARLFPILTEEVRRMLGGSAFTGRDLMRSQKPVTVYLRLPEEDLSALAPITRLVLESFIHELFATYKAAEDEGQEETCRPVLFILDEAGRSASLASLPDHLTTVRSRGVSILLAIQTLSQLESLYPHRWDDVLNNCLSHVYFQPFSYKTANELSQWLGYTSAFATSYSSHGGEDTSEGHSEREVHLLSPDDARLFGTENVLIFRDGIRPFLARRMDWHRFPLLTKRSQLAPAPVPALPPLADPLPVITETPTTATGEKAPSEPPPEDDADPLASWHLDRALYRRWPQRRSANGMRKASSSNDADDLSKKN